MFHVELIYINLNYNYLQKIIKLCTFGEFIAKKMWNGVPVCGISVSWNMFRLASRYAMADDSRHKFICMLLIDNNLGYRFGFYTHY